jgi:hypothetical protein
MSGMSISRRCRYRPAFGHRGCRSHYPSVGRFAGGWQLLSTTTRDAFKDWCDRQGITPRFGAVGQHGSIALVERFILSLKNECTRLILVPLRSESCRRELMWYAGWFNQNRPHSALDGKTPHEVYHKLLPACERPRFEPRARWPRAARCASPHAPVTGNCGAPIRLDVRYHGSRNHLPIIDLRLAA